MSRVTITLHIDIPDGAVPDVGYSDTPEEPADLFPPFQGYDRDEVVTPQAIRDAPAPLCQHGIAMSRYPAGVNKQGKPYNSSWRPSDPNCLTKPLWDRDAA